MEKILSRLSTKDFFGYDHIGYRSYQFESYYPYVEDYVKKQRELDEVFGLLGIVDLVEKDMADRFRKALHKLQVTMSMVSNNLRPEDEVKYRAEICKRGLDAMKSYVVKNDLWPTVETLICEIDNKKLFGVVKNDSDVKIAKANHKDVSVFYSLTELYVILKSYESIRDMKEKFDKTDKVATVKQISQPKEIEELFDDEIPF